MVDEGSELTFLRPISYGACCAIFSIIGEWSSVWEGIPLPGGALLGFPHGIYGGGNLVKEFLYWQHLVTVGILTCGAAMTALVFLHGEGVPLLAASGDPWYSDLVARL